MCVCSWFGREDNRHRVASLQPGDAKVYRRAVDQVRMGTWSQFGHGATKGSGEI
jgi:hypothetical protein